MPLNSVLEKALEDFSNFDVEENRLPLLIKDTWPCLQSEALHGLAGDIVKAIGPYTEADPVGVLAHLLTAFGNAVGSGPHFRVEYKEHRPRLFAGLVGETSKGRKGTSWSNPRYLMRQVDPDWEKNCVTSGLSTGEGLIYHVRDTRHEKQPIKRDGKVEEYQEVIVDHGVDDKRLMVVEEEMATVLKVAAREGNILSAVLRQAWDSGDLHPLTKSNPIRATGAHISIVGHITTQELLRHLTETEKVNGFANRFIWLLVRRSKVIPNPTGAPPEVTEPLVVRLRAVFETVKAVTLMQRDAESESLWAAVYEPLSNGKPGILGAILGRAEVQVMRVACLYALFDGSSQIQLPHLKAALALWDFSEASAFRIFGNKVGDPTADRILESLRVTGNLNRTEISNLFMHNKPASEIERALNALEQYKLVTKEEVKTSGRPETRWKVTK